MLVAHAGTPLRDAAPWWPHSGLHNEAIPLQLRSPPIPQVNDRSYVFAQFPPPDFRLHHPMYLWFCKLKKYFCFPFSFRDSNTNLLPHMTHILHFPFSSGFAFAFFIFCCYNFLFIFYHFQFSFSIFSPNFPHLLFHRGSVPGATDAPDPQPPIAKGAPPAPAASRTGFGQPSFPSPIMSLVSK